MKQRLFFALAAATLVSLSPSVYAQALPARGGHVPGELIIQFNSNVTDEQIATAFRQGGLKLKEHVATPAMKDHGKIGLTRVATTMQLEAAIEILSNLPGIDFAELNGIGTADIESNDPYYLGGSLWGTYSDDLPSASGPAVTSNIYGSQVEKVWAAGFVGSPDVYVGVIDQGFQPDHPDLAANVWTNPGEIPGDGIDNDGNGYIDDVHGWNGIDNNGVIYDPALGHGTHVAGTIGAVGGNGIGVVGMNWNVKLIAGKAGDAAGIGILSAIKAIDYMTALKTKNGLNIVALNNSYSGGGTSQALQDAFARAAQAGILAVCSASNQGANNNSSPRWPANADTTSGAGFDSIVSVAAIDQAGGKASFSNYGLYSVDLGAPGVDILSTVPDGGYSLGSGTSMSTPHVTGAVALYASVYPAATAAQIKTRLLTAGVVSTPSLTGLTLTGGRLDAYALITAPGSTVTLPLAPSGLSATVPKAPAKGVVNLAWLDRSNNEKGFVIERKTSTTTTWQMIATLGANITTFSDTAVASRTTCNYRLRAFNVAGSSAYSNEVTVTVK
jgi:subtilisin family serine protease